MSPTPNAAYDEDDTSPFATSAPVDGIVYHDDPISPELRMLPRSVETTPLPVRPTAQPIATGDTSPWRPGPEVDPDKFKRKKPRGNPVKGFLIGMVPILFIVGLVLAVANLYGDTIL